METHRLKMKIGDCEIEAEGTKETVQAQFEVFRELVLSAVARPTSAPTSPTGAATSTAQEDTAQQHLQPEFDLSDIKLDKIMKVEDRIVSLTVRPSTIQEAILLILYGQRVLRNNDAVTGNEVMEGLKISGASVNRVDRLLEKAAAENDVIVIGYKRAKRYRLTNVGFRKASKKAYEYLGIVA